MFKVTSYKYMIEKSYESSKSSNFKEGCKIGFVLRSPHD